MKSGPFHSDDGAFDFYFVVHFINSFLHTLHVLHGDLFDTKRRPLYRLRRGRVAREPKTTDEFAPMPPAFAHWLRPTAALIYQ